MRRTRFLYPDVVGALISVLISWPGPASAENRVYSMRGGRGVGGQADVQVEVLLGGDLHKKLAMIRTLLRRGNESQRVRVVLALGRTRNPDVKWILVEFLKRDPSAAVREVAATLVGARLGGGDLPQVEALMQKERDPGVRRKLEMVKTRLARLPEVVRPPGGRVNVSVQVKVDGRSRCAGKDRAEKREDKTRSARCPVVCCCRNNGGRAGLKVRSGRRWRLRLGASLAVYGDFMGMDAAAGGEFALQLEFSNRSILQVVGLYGLGREYDDVNHPRTFLFGGGIGYAYEWGKKNSVRFEFGATLGFYALGRDGISMAFVLLRPTFHIPLGTRKVYLSFGPRVTLGVFPFWGLAAGLTIGP